jgi:CheY-like chemotaxis protein
VTVAGNGKAGVEAALGGGFDLVLMDIQMPEVDPGRAYCTTL